jgi:hypothetical protein
VSVKKRINNPVVVDRRRGFVIFPVPPIIRVAEKS